MSDSAKARVCVITPAFNEAGSIKNVLTQIAEHLPDADRIVINDGSRDQTAHEAKAAGAAVVTLPLNLGIGGAVQTGLKYAFRGNYDYAIEIDADGQHNPVYAPKLLNHAIQSGADMVIGSRFVASTEYRSSLLRRFGIHLFSWLIKLVTNKRIYDSTSGFRVYNRRALAFLHRRYPTDFPEPESIVMVLTRGYRISEVPVEMKERQAGVSVVGSDMSLKALYFVLSNAIAILIAGLKTRRYRAQ